MSQPKVRENKNALFAVGGMVVAGGILNRLNVSVFGLWSYTGPVYIPSLMEIVVTAALFTFGGGGLRRADEAAAGLPEGAAAGSGGG